MDPEAVARAYQRPNSSELARLEALLRDLSAQVQALKADVEALKKGIERDRWSGFRRRYT